MSETAPSAPRRAAAEATWLALGGMAVAGAGLAFGVLLGQTGGLRQVSYVVGASLLLALAFLRKEWFALLFLGAITLVEEFPTTLVFDRRFDRSLTYLYGKSLGLPGLYGSDLLLLLSLVIFGGSEMLRRRGAPLRRDPVFLPLAATAACIVLSAIVSLFVFPDTASAGAYRTSELGFAMKQSVAGLVPYFQFKTWLYVYASFVAWRQALRSPALLHRALTSLFVAMVGVVGIGVARYLLYRHKLGPLSPLYYDDATIFFMTVMACFFVFAWGQRLFSRPLVLAQAGLTGLSLAITVLSMRRANLLGLAICFALVLLLIPGWFRWRLVAGAVVAGLAGLVLVLVMGWHVDLGSARGSVSAEMRSSSLYRTALLYNMLKGTHFTLLGYGVRPLWNERLVMGSFQLNFENVHSIYYWFILRTGLLGLGAFLVAMGTALVEAFRLSRAAVRPAIRALAQTILVALVLYLFVGLFHPVYAMARFTVILGFLLALLMTLREVNVQTWTEGEGAG